MLKNNYYKNCDILDDSFRNRMNSYFNPYEYNFDSNIKNNINSDLVVMKSKNHNDRRKTKNK